jgi:hypothetical protein
MIRIEERTNVIYYSKKVARFIYSTILFFALVASVILLAFVVTGFLMGIIFIINKSMSK